MNASKQLAKKLKSKFSEKQNELLKQPGVMGDGDGHLAPDGLSGFTYITVGDKALPVFNNRVAPRLGTKVWVGYANEEDTLFQVLSTRSDTPSGVTNNGLGYAPAKRYEWNAVGGGEDPLHVHLRALSLLKLGMSSAGGMNVELFSGYVWTGSTHLYIARQDVDLTAQIPAGADNAALVLITISSGGAVVQTKGAEVNIYALALTDLPAPPASTIFVCGAVRVYEGQTAVQEGRVNTDFVDLRFAGSMALSDVAGRSEIFLLMGA